MRVAFAFRRPDVDALLAELDADQYEEWLAFFAHEPQGWAATQIVTTRLSYLLAQTHSRKKLRERDFSIRLAAAESGKSGPAAESARFEAMSVRTEIAEAARSK